MKFHHITAYRRLSRLFSGLSRFLLLFRLQVGREVENRRNCPIIESSSNLVGTNHKILLLKVFTTKITVACWCLAASMLLGVLAFSLRLGICIWQ